MAVINTMEELKKVRDKAKAALNMEGEANKTRIVVGLGTCGIASGAGHTMKAIEDELKKRNVENVELELTGCIGFCEFEPLVDIIRPNQPKVTYIKVDEEKARQIVEKHVINNEIIDEWIVPNI